MYLSVSLEKKNIVRKKSLKKEEVLVIFCQDIICYKYLFSAYA